VRRRLLAGGNQPERDKKQKRREQAAASILHVLGFNLSVGKGTGKAFFRRRVAARKRTPARTNFFYFFAFSSFIGGLMPLGD
jgi:hypothetical protein